MGRILPSLFALLCEVFLKAAAAPRSCARSILLLPDTIANDDVLYGTNHSTAFTGSSCITRRVQRTFNNRFVFSLEDKWTGSQWEDPGVCATAASDDNRRPFEFQISHARLRRSLPAVLVYFSKK